MTRHASLVVLVLVSAIGPAALHIVTPALPLLAAAFASPASSVQLVLTLFLAGIAAGQLVCGPISDRYGRRPVLVGGLALFLFGTALCGIAWSMPVLIFGRVLQACGGCAGMVIGRAIVRDIYDRERAASAIATIAMATSLAPSLAPAVGGYLAEWLGWRADFALLGTLGAAVFAVTAARLEETLVHSVQFDGKAMAGNFALLLRSPAFLGFSLACAFTSASWFSFIAVAPYLLVDLLHRPLSTYGLMILWPMAAYILGSAIAARFAVRFGSAALFVAGLALSLAAGALMTAWIYGIGLSGWAMFVPMALSSIGNGLSQPPGISGGLSVHPRIAGAASGMIGFLQMMLAAIGTWLVGLLPQTSALGMVAVVDMSLLLALVLGLAALRAPASIRSAALDVPGRAAE
jgi:DHA1 family bicyclomycin/chloramphenicol resistance-like MFS transporter